MSLPDMGQHNLDLKARANLRSMATRDLTFCYQRTRAEPQVNPPPIASKRIKLPDLMRPSATAAQSASGIEAAEVLPWRSTVETTFCGAICSLCAEASMIRLFAWCG